MILSGEKLERPLEEVFDYVVVGSGAAGATAARILADTGRSLAVLEEGPAVDSREFSDLAYPSFKRLLRGMGCQTARGGGFMPVLQGRCLGGSTVVNSAIVWRLPEEVLADWSSEYGLGKALPPKELNENWDTIERELSVAPTPPEAWGEFNRLMDKARSTMRVSAGPTIRNVRGCRASARCLTGCPYGAKQSMAVSYLPYAEKKGAALVTGARVERVLWDGERAAGVAGSLEGPGRNFRVYARKAVILAASAIQTPGILRRSGLANPHLGEHFQAHPGCALIGIFDHEVGMWSGATQGYEADHHRSLGRFKVETISLPPELVLARFPGAGKRWAQSMAEATQAAIWAVQLRAWAEGSVRERLFGANIRFAPCPRDMVNLRRALRFTAEMLFAAGARAVLPGIYGLPERLLPGEASMLEAAPEDPSCYAMILSHLFGTARMSPRPAEGVVGPDFCVHGAERLYVIDSSVFPTNTGVNPQHPIMGIAMLAARRLAEGP